MWHSCLTVLLFLTPALLAFPGQATADASSSSAASTTPKLEKPLSRQEAQQLLNVLNNPKERESFTHTLSLMARGLPVETSSPQPAATVAVTPAPKPPAASPKKVVDVAQVSPDIHSGLSSIRSQTLTYVNNFLGLFSDLRFVGHEARNQLSNPQTRKIIFNAFSAALAVMICGLVLERVLVLTLRPHVVQLTASAQKREQKPRSDPGKLPAGAPADDTSKTRAADQRRQVETLRFLVRIPYALGHFALKALPVLAFYLLAWLSTLIFPWSQKTDDVILTLANCYAGARCLYLFVETGFAPHSPTIRLLPASDQTALLLTRWWNFLVAAPAIIFCLSNLGSQFNISPRGTDAMIRAIVLVEHIMIAVFIWRIRHIVTRALLPNRNGKTTAMWAFIAAVARLWWVPAMFLDISLWVVWAAHLPGGYRWILSTTGMTIGILVVSRLIAILAYGLQDRFFRVNPALVERFPEIQERADRYYPVARAVLTGIIVFLTLLAMTEAWGLPTINFFLHNAIGTHLLDAVITMLIAVTVAVAIWETVNALLGQQLTRFEKSGLNSRATRLRTVLPIIRTVLLAIISIIVTVTTLSQIGINVTPLLTGAGIMGAAIAFGSQSLVKDFITGFFMLVEDAIQVGDWVTTGGVSGTVENLSIRTVKVRDINGDLHIIPFSSVSSIANTARGYNQVIVKQQLDLSEDLPRVSAIMAKVVKELRDDTVFGPMILSDYNDLGVDNSDSGGATLLGSIRTAPMMKWKVKREFYRRVANRFAEANVKFYTGTSYFTTPPGVAMHLVNDSAPVPPAPANDVDAAAPPAGKPDTKKPDGDSHPDDSKPS
ncbi:mechanosensitive ion channel Small-conductance MscS [Gluconobacter morbifer G707]|uniref:Mechanosensitive ion channel Small-conductance MscS n=2 Tax=Gluconobacter TaxID=441 RepID=G6XK64_9PROT|nr:mechanosensitive ion channel Small-conductance MscS [Gluconobacter morbifer G707]